MCIVIFALLVYISDMNKPDTLISVRCDTPEDKKFLQESATKVKRKLGPFLYWASLEYIKEHPELFQKK